MKLYGGYVTSLNKAYKNFANEHIKKVIVLQGETELFGFALNGYNMKKKKIWLLY